MYESFYGFDESPFRLSADNKLCFYHQSYEKAFKGTVSALEEGEAFVVVSGRPGTGKTTLCKDIISHFDSNGVLTVNMLASHFESEELLRKVALDLDLAAEKYDKAEILSSLERYMKQLCQGDKRLMIFLDEAQNLSVNSLKNLVQLTRLMEGGCAVPQIVLFGHTGLRDVVSDVVAESVQRIALSCELENMTPNQTRDYVLHRLYRVGWKSDPGISDSVFTLLYEVTGGSPRLINHVMNRVLQIAAFENSHHIDDEELLQAVRLLVEENRLSLVSGETFALFKQRYLATKVISDDPYHSGQMRGEVLAGKEFGQTFSQFYKQNSIIHESLSEQDKSSRDEDTNTDEDEFGFQCDDSEFPDTDLLGWDEYEPQHQPSAKMQKGIGSNPRNSVSGFKQATERESDNGKGTESEHQWGGVWWMSNSTQKNNHKELKGRSIATDELPAIEIEECPEMTTSISPPWGHGRGESSGLSGLKLSLIIALSLFGVGSVVMLIL